jgi:hypothetical protein
MGPRCIFDSLLYLSSPADAKRKLREGKGTQVVPTVTVSTTWTPFPRRVHTLSLWTASPGMTRLLLAQ